MKKWIDVTEPQVGDMADRKDMDLDPRPVAEVRRTLGHYWEVRIQIGDNRSSWLPADLYTYRREVDQPIEGGQITTAAELEALPEGSIVQGVEFDWHLATKNRCGEWMVTMSDVERTPEDLAEWLLPAIVVRRGRALIDLEDRIQRMVLALTEQRVIDSRHFGEAPYAPITRADAIAALYYTGTEEE